MHGAAGVPREAWGCTSSLLRGPRPAPTPWRATGTPSTHSVNPPRAGSSPCHVRPASPGRKHHKNIPEFSTKFFRVFLFKFLQEKKNAFFLYQEGEGGSLTPCSSSGGPRHDNCPETAQRPPFSRRPHRQGPGRGRAAPGGSRTSTGPRQCRGDLEPNAVQHDSETRPRAALTSSPRTLG